MVALTSTVLDAGPFGTLATNGSVGEVSILGLIIVILKQLSKVIALFNLDAIILFGATFNTFNGAFVKTSLQPLSPLFTICMSTMASFVRPLPST